MERQILGKEIIRMIDGTDREVTLQAVSEFEYANCMTKNTSNMGNVAASLDTSNLIKDILAIGIQEDVPIEYIARGFMDIYEKYYNLNNKEMEAKK